MKRNEIIIICLLFLLAFGLRFYEISYPDFKWGDEMAHVPAGTNYWLNGQFEPDNWEHPPLRHILMYGFLQLFGDNPYGWRMRNILFGAAACVLTYLFARNVSGGRKAALLAGVLLATDPLHIVMSRYTFEEIYGGAFFLAAIVLYQRHAGRSWLIAASAFFMGCALATKWYYVPCWLLIYLLLLRENRNYRSLGTAFFITATYLFIPASVFIGSYYFWFMRGYAFPEFLQFIQDAYFSLQTYRPENYNPEMVFLSHSSALEWFIRSITVGQGTFIGADRGEFILYMNSLPVWIATLPAMVMLAVLAQRRKSVELGLPVLLFFGTYSLFIGVKRPTFIYSAAPLLPFAFTAIGCMVTEVTGRVNARLYHLVLVTMLAWNLYLYPLATAKNVPVAPYRYLLDESDAKLFRQ
ncbi:phospholipid carrier-dependent glycosyltransferase [Geomonas azotofigens]|uniref:phospholipid carrier-dependent glycosyltransferase n=1 Tax=Geomonas azotofigens TaxID=2843196 RepID=UPI001C11FEFC|nr:phospholipid carrier-dependent glycosyltransferase [Geomonas azotofigens]MBU5615183.1 phospholipid carrier-dependent glycosyltransferase [Geomonas azotofigens]